MERTTSFAKSVEGLDHPPSALDRVRALRHYVATWFQKEPQPSPARTEERTEQRGEGSAMVRQDAPGLHLRPRGVMRSQVDHAIVYGRLGKERAQTTRKNRRIALSQEFRQEREDRSAGRSL